MCAKGEQESRNVTLGRIEIEKKYMVSKKISEKKKNSCLENTIILYNEIKSVGSGARLPVWI